MKIKASQLKALIMESLNEFLKESALATEAPLPMAKPKLAAPVANPVAKPAIAVPAAKAPRAEGEPDALQGKQILQGILSGQVDPMHLDANAKASIQALVGKLGITLSETSALNESAQKTNLKKMIRQTIKETLKK